MAATSEAIATKLVEAGLKDTRFYRFLDKALPHIKRYLPYNRYCDNLYHRLLFMKKHRRMPGKKLLWNDVS